MDEPLSALDKRLRQDMQEELRHLHRNLGTTIVYVTHDQDEALALSDTIALMRDGRIEQVGAPADVYSRPRTLFAASFLGEANLLAGRVRQVMPSGVVSLTLSNGRIVEATPISTVAEEEPGVLVVRPENLRLTTDLERAVRVTVAEAIYLGSTVRCVGSFETGERCVLTLDIPAGTDLVRRGGGYVTWQPEDAVLVPADADRLDRSQAPLRNKPAVDELDLVASDPAPS
jgi:putative spermidine/putrescine transport system ATP-binding protein